MIMAIGGITHLMETGIDFVDIQMKIIPLKITELEPDVFSKKIAVKFESKRYFE